MNNAAHEHEHAAPPATDNLLLDIGADTGALIIHADPGRDQTEIEISPTAGALTRTHNVVRRRQGAAGVTYAAVFPALAAGGYVVWRDTVTVAGTVTVQGGKVASFRLDRGDAGADLTAGLPPHRRGAGMRRAAP